MTTELLNTIFFLSLFLVLIGGTIWKSTSIKWFHFLAALLTPGMLIIAPFIDQKDHRYYSLLIVGIGYLILAIIAGAKGRHEEREKKGENWLIGIFAATGLLGVIFVLIACVCILSTSH